MPALLPQSTLILAGCLLVSATFGYLYSSRRERVMLEWSLAWAALGAAAVGDYAVQATRMVSLVAVPLGLEALAATLITWGAYGMAGRRRPRHLMLVAAAVTGWALVTRLAGQPSSIAGLPAIVYTGAATLTAGVAILRGTGEHVDTDRVSGVALGLWGLEHLFAPTLLGEAWFVPWAPTVDAAFMVVGAAAMVVSYYERVRLRLELGEERFRLLAEAGNDVILRRRMFPAPAWEYVSPAAERVLGYSPQSFYDDPSFTDGIWYEEDREGVRQLAADGFPEHLPFAMRWRAPDGRTVWTEQTLSAVRDEEGSIRGWQAVARDVTPRVKAEEALRESEQRYSSFFRNNSSPIIVIDPDDMRIADANAAACEFYGFTLDRFRTMSVADLSTAPPEVFTDRAEGIVEGTAPSFVTRHRMADGSERDVEVYSGHVQAGEKTLGVVIVHDVGERVAAEAEVARYRERLEELVEERTKELLDANTALARATRVKDEFLANMSHELRTPLNSIIGFSTVLLQGMAGGLNAEQRTQLEMVRRAGRHLLELVNDLLDISRIEMGALRPEAREFDAAEVVRGLAESIRPLCDGKSLALSTRIPDTPVACCTDRRFVEQIVLNLLSNAVKFTDAGGVTVSLDEAGRDIAVAVSDTGPGLPEGQERRVFDRFVQFPVAGDAKPDGTGLGLAISTKLAAALGGRLEVVTGDGGATFTLKIPKELPSVLEPAPV